MNRRQSWNIITLFCVCIFGFTIATFLKPSDTYSETENRSLAQFPEISMETVLNGKFEKDYENYLKDQFIGRDHWISLKTDTEKALLQKESKDIYFAGDDYLIEKHTGVFTTDQSTLNINYLRQFIQMYQEQFGEDHMCVMIIPNAVDILKEKLPAYASPYDQEIYLDKIQGSLPEGMMLRVSDELIRHQDEYIYYRTDHHWTTLGAFYAYQKWAENQGYQKPQLSDYEREVVTADFEGTIQSKLGIETTPDQIERFVPVEDLFYEMYIDQKEVDYDLYKINALDTKNKYDYFFGGNHPVVRLVTRQNTGKKLLLVKDSYAHCFTPFLMEHFDEIIMVDLRYYTQKLSDLIAQEAFTDFLFLNNASGFAEETALIRLTY